MSKHKMVNGKLLQMNKRYSQLKGKQKEKISGWMYEAYKRQVEQKLSNEDALQYVLDKIDEADIWIPWYEVRDRYFAKKKQFEKRLARENVPKHLFEMEGILNRATQKMDALEKKIEEYKEFQSEIQKLEAYYTSQQWKEDFEMDEKGELPENLRRGILSEDGIYNLLERNKELLERLD